ncbi:MAG: hypothetical protein PHI68_03480, partial [Candidatus Cloacimonetes bacterium]|nr:hypothetical protein [Candidatus Cloacimonadota bacterium]
DETYLSQTFLNFDFALKISNHADLVSAGREGKYLLRFELVGVDKSGKRISLKHKLESAKEASTESYLTAKAYLALSRKDGLGNSRIKLSISFKDLKDSGLLIENEAGRYQMRDVHPRIYWYENSKLEIDYLEVYDDLYQSMKTNPERYARGINSRLDNIRNLSSAKIRFMYSFDEPNQAQFAAFKQVQELIEAPNPTIITAIYDWKHYLKKPNKEDYNHQVNFIKQAEPMVLCPDIYPLDRWQSWKPKAFQRIIDSRVTDKYMQWRTLIEEGKKAGKEMHFMPIVQSFGDWFSKDEAWGWMLPPYETQKMLQYLPLCYGPIGILNYVFPWWIGDKLAEPQTYGPLMIHTSQTPFSYERTESFRALQEANGKIQIYGNIVKDLDWETAATLRLFRNPRGELAQFGIEKIRVAWNWKEFKRQGYVQMGVYTDEQGLPSLVLVNRRSNESSRELPGRIKLDEYKANFKAASSQQVILSLNGKVLSGRAKDITIYDPFLLEGQEIIHSGLKAKNIKLKYSIEAGEAMMLRVVNTLPLNLAKDVELAASYALTARGVVSGNSTLKLGKNAELALLKGSSLVIDSGSTAILKGEISAHPDAKIEVYGQLVISGKNKSRLKDNIIIQPGGVVSLGD